MCRVHLAARRPGHALELGAHLDEERRVRPNQPHYAFRRFLQVVRHCGLQGHPEASATSECLTWQARRDSNPQPPVLETVLYQLSYWPIFT